MHTFNPLVSRFAKINYEVKATVYMTQGRMVGSLDEPFYGFSFLKNHNLFLGETLRVCPVHQ